MSTDHLSRARKLLDKGQVNEAGQACATALQNNPGSAAAFSLMGQILLRSEKLKPAFQHFQKAAMLEADNPVHHADAGHVLVLGGQLKDAEKALTRALELGSQDPCVLHDLGGTYLMTERFDKAAETFEKATVLAPDTAWSHSNLGIALHQIGRHEDAVAAYRRAIEIDPKDDNTHFNLGLTLGALRQEDAAVAAFEEAGRIAPKRPDVAKNIGQVKLTGGDYQGAVTQMQRAIVLNPADNQSQLSLTYALTYAERAPEAIALCKEIIQKAPKIISARNTLALAYLRSGKPEDAIVICDEVLALKPGETAALSNKSAALNQLGRRDEAAEILSLDTLVHANIYDVDGTGYDTLAEFNAAFSAFIKSHPTLHYTANNRTLSSGQCTRDIFDGGNGPMVDAMKLMIERAVQDYKNTHPVEPGHPFLFRHPSRHKLVCWANVMDQGGFHDAHIHPTAWLSGVYYPQMPGNVSDNDPDHEAWIEFGRAYAAVKSGDDPPVRVVMPEEGMFVMFPSYTGHRTIPFQSSKKRVSVAFDVESLD